MRMLVMKNDATVVVPATLEAAHTLALWCPCAAFAAQQPTVLTVCPQAACKLPWINFSSISAPHYGVVEVRVRQGFLLLLCMFVNIMT